MFDISVSPKLAAAGPLKREREEEEEKEEEELPSWVLFSAPSPSAPQ